MNRRTGMTLGEFAERMRRQAQALKRVSVSYRDIAGRQRADEATRSSRRKRDGQK